jgi:hypothetical protein
VPTAGWRRRISSREIWPSLRSWPPETTETGWLAVVSERAIRVPVTTTSSTAAGGGGSGGGGTGWTLRRVIKAPVSEATSRPAPAISWASAWRGS